MWVGFFEAFNQALIQLLICDEKGYEPLLKSVSHEITPYWNSPESLQ